MKDLAQSEKERGPSLLQNQFFKNKIKNPRKTKKIVGGENSLKKLRNRFHTPKRFTKREITVLMKNFPQLLNEKYVLKC